MQKFSRLDRECVELSYERGAPRNDVEMVQYLTELMTVCEEGSSLWGEIKVTLGQESTVGVNDPGIAKAIRKICEGGGFFLLRQRANVLSPGTV